MDNPEGRRASKGATSHCAGGVPRGLNVGEPWYCGRMVGRFSCFTHRARRGGQRLQRRTARLADAVGYGERLSRWPPCQHSPWPRRRHVFALPSPSDRAKVEKRTQLADEDSLTEGLKADGPNAQHVAGRRTTGKVVRRSPSVLRKQQLFGRFKRVLQLRYRGGIRHERVAHLFRRC